MSERAPYSRVYWSILDDPKFATIYDDDAHLATWLRMLLAADQAHPNSGHVPAGCPSSSVEALVAAGLVDLQGSRYRIHGLDAERGRRRIAASREPTVTERDPDGPRSGPRRDPDGDGRVSRVRVEGQGVQDDGDQTGPVRVLAQARASSSSSSSSSDEGGAGGNGAEPPWLRSWFRAGRDRPPTQRQRGVIESFLKTFDQTGLERLAAILDLYPDEAIGVMIKDLKEFRAERRAAADAEEAVAAERRAEWRPRPLNPASQELAEHLRRQEVDAVTERDPDGPPEGPAIGPPVRAEDEAPTVPEPEVMATAQAPQGDPPTCDECGHPKVQVGDTDRWICTYWPGHVKPTPSAAPTAPSRPTFEEATV